MVSTKYERERAVDTRINFINNSNDANNSQIVIFQKNVANIEFTPIAWQVISGLGPKGRHPFILSSQFELDCTDAWGNYTNRQTVDQLGMQFEMGRTSQGDVLRAADPPIHRGAAPSGARLINRLPMERTRAAPYVQANAYKDGKLVATMTLNPGDEGGFEFAPVIYIGAASNAVEGTPLAGEVAWLLDTKLSLYGIFSADIVMTGGGSGPKAPPLEFALAKVIRAR